MPKKSEEWLRQADYDLETAEFMFKGHRMDKKSVINIISRFRSALEASGIRIDKIILYGSWAKNTQSESSDIDLVVISEDFKDKGYWERIDILSAAIYEVFEPIEAVAMTPEEWEKEDSFISLYARDGEWSINKGCSTFMCCNQWCGYL